MSATLRVAGLVSGEQLGLGLASEHKLIGIDLTIVAFLLDIAVDDEGMSAIAESLAHKVAIELLGIETVDGLQLEALTVRPFPLGVVKDYHQEERLDMDVAVEFENLMAERQMGVGFDQFQHPQLVVFEAGVTVAEILADMALELVDELLLGEAVNLLRDEGLVMTQGGDDTTFEPDALDVVTHFISTLADGPALGDEFFYLLGIDHDA